MPGVNKVDVGICRVWVYLDDDNSRRLCAGLSLASIIGGLCDPELVTKIALAAGGCLGVIVSCCNHGKGVILKFPHALGMLAHSPPEVCPQ